MNTKHKKINEKIAAFLKDRRKSTPGGGYADITSKDVDDLEDIIDLLVAAKCEEDCDGDLPIQIRVVNRITHEGLSFAPQPYTKNRDNIMSVLSVAAYNADIANDRLSRTIRLMEIYQREDKEEAEKNKKK